MRPAGQEQFEVPEGDGRARKGKFDIATQWKVESVTHCFDIKTGKTLWRYVFPKGQRKDGGKRGGHYTATTDSGYVSAVDSAGRLFTLKAETGELVWEVWLTYPHRGEDNKMKPRAYHHLYDDCVKADKNLYRTGINQAPGSVDGVVALAHTRERVVGYDIASGEQLWEVKVHGGGLSVRDVCVVPVIWKHQGKKYFVVANTAIEPRTGKVLWKIPGAKTTSAPCIDEHHYICAESGEDNGSTCYRIGLDGVKKLWSLEKGRTPTMACTDVLVGK